MADKAVQCNWTAVLLREQVKRIFPHEFKPAWMTVLLRQTIIWDSFTWVRGGSNPSKTCSNWGNQAYWNSFSLVRGGSTPLNVLEPQFDWGNHVDRKGSHELGVVQPLRTCSNHCLTDTLPAAIALNYSVKNIQNDVRKMKKISIQLTS